jgi:hypothetical protein
MKYCPQCKAEYRQGFARCADCDVPLMPGLPEAEKAVSKGIPSGHLVPLWEGEDLALHTTLLEELEAADIRYFDQPMGTSPGVRRGDPFPVQAMVRFGYQVAVLSSDLASARGILEKLLEEESEELELPADDGEDGGQLCKNIADGEEEMTCEVWSGAETRQASFLRDALRENDIRIHSVESGLDLRLLVRPSDESAAREIVREVLEATPPA